MVNALKRPSGFMHLMYLCLIAALLFSPMGHGQEALLAPVGEPAEPEKPAEPQVQDEVPEYLSSPRLTMDTFLTRMGEVKAGEKGRLDLALETLDLSAINPLVQHERGADLAWVLLEVLDRTRYVDIASIPDRQDGAPYVFETYPNGRIQISRLADGRWLFDAETINSLTAILDSLQNRTSVFSDADRSYLPWHIRLRENLPASLKSTAFILENWQWLGLLLTIFVGLILDRLIAFILKAWVGRWRASNQHPAYEGLPADLLRPLGLLATALIWWTGIRWMGLPEQAMLILLTAVKFLASISGVWATYRLVDLFAAYLALRAEQTESKLDDALVPLIRKSLKIFVTVVGIVFVAHNLRINVSSLLAGLGLGGLAFALAAKDMVQNLFGSITVLMDRTFIVGDWIIVDGIEGTVERIGFRSTRIRTFYNSLIMVPNSKFITASVDNMGERRYRRYSFHLGVARHTPAAGIEALCAGISELVEYHPFMRKDYHHVYLNRFSESSLDILIYVFWETPDWATELRERHRFLLDIIRLARSLEIDLAFPTRSLYMMESDQPSSDSFSPDKAAEAGRQAAKGIAVSQEAPSFPKGI